MLLRRIDDLVPGGGSLDLHPRLTLLRAIGPEPRRRLEALVRSLAEGVVPDGAESRAPGATIELSGVQLALDAATLDRLEIDQRIDPVIVLGGAGAPAPLPEDTPPFIPAPAPSASPSLAPESGESLAELRTSLREVGDRRSELGDRMEAARARLDSFSTAALEVCVGQIEALESRRSQVRAAVEQRQHELAELSEAAERIRGDLARIERIDATRVPAARAALVAAVEAPVPPDPAAVALADQLDETLHRFRRVQADRAAAELRLGEARQRLGDASAELVAAQVGQHGTGDPETIRRLEEVREEIFAAGDRGIRRAPGRAKRRLAELRAEEAVLLDRLGFDTYSAYIMGISSVRADVDRSNRMARAEQDVARIRAELDELRSSSPGEAELERVAAELEGLVLVASRDLDPTGSLPALGGLDPAGRAELVYELIEALRNRRVAPSGVEDPAVRAAADALHTALVEAAPPGPDADATGPVPPPAAAPVEDLLAAADAWSSWQRGIVAWSEDAVARLEAIDREIEQADAGGRSAGDPVAEWAELESALDSALDRLGAAQERVRAHEAATAEVAQLREAELDLRSRERPLLAAIAAAEAAPDVSSAPASATPTIGPSDVPGAQPGAERGSGAATTPTGADDEQDAHWELLRRLARQRRVSFVGSLPLLVIGVGPSGSRGEVQARLARMSDLVQIVLVSDDDDVAAWAHGLGATASVLEVAPRR